jgi:hypothetical protein
MEKWVITCNPKYFDVIGAFSTFERLHWKQSVNIKVGDIVFIYVGKPLGAIKYETKAVKVDLTEAIIDSDYIIDGSNYENYGRYMELQLVRNFDDRLLPLKTLKENGLNSVQGPSKVSERLDEFLMYHINQLNGSDE